MQHIGENRANPKLKEMVVEASRALARLDVERLEELALCCQALNRDLSRGDLADGDGQARALLAVEARAAGNDMAVFARVLEATRANLNVMNRLRELRAGRLGYREGPLEYLEGRPEYGPQAPGWRRMESGHGND